MVIKMLTHIGGIYTNSKHFTLTLKQILIWTRRHLKMTYLWRPGVLQFMGLQRVGHDWVTELNWTDWRGLSMYHFLPVWQHRVTGSPDRQSFSSAVSRLGVHFLKILRALSHNVHKYLSHWCHRAKGKWRRVFVNKVEFPGIDCWQLRKFFTTNNHLKLSFSGLWDTVSHWSLIQYLRSVSDSFEDVCMWWGCMASISKLGCGSWKSLSLNLKGDSRWRWIETCAF